MSSINSYRKQEGHTSNDRQSSKLEREYKYTRRTVESPPRSKYTKKDTDLGQRTTAIKRTSTDPTAEESKSPGRNYTIKIRHDDNGVKVQSFVEDETGVNHLDPKNKSSVNTDLAGSVFETKGKNGKSVIEIDFKHEKKTVRSREGSVENSGRKASEFSFDQSHNESPLKFRDRGAGLAGTKTLRDDSPEFVMNRVLEDSAKKTEPYTATNRVKTSTYTYESKRESPVKDSRGESRLVTKLAFEGTPVKDHTLRKDSGSPRRDHVKMRYSQTPERSKERLYGVGAGSNAKRGYIGSNTYRDNRTSALENKSSTRTYNYHKTVERSSVEKTQSKKSEYSASNRQAYKPITRTTRITREDPRPTYTNKVTTTSRSPINQERAANNLTTSTSYYERLTQTKDERSPATRVITKDYTSRPTVASYNVKRDLKSYTKSPRNPGMNRHTYGYQGPPHTTTTVITSNAPVEITTPITATDYNSRRIASPINRGAEIKTTIKTTIGRASPISSRYQKGSALSRDYSRDRKVTTTTTSRVNQATPTYSRRDYYYGSPRSKSPSRSPIRRDLQSTIKKTTNTSNIQTRTSQIHSSLNGASPIRRSPEANVQSRVYIEEKEDTGDGIPYERKALYENGKKIYDDRSPSRGRASPIRKIDYYSDEEEAGRSDHTGELADNEDFYGFDHKERKWIQEQKQSIRNLKHSMNLETSQRINEVKNTIERDLGGLGQTRVRHSVTVLPRREIGRAAPAPRIISQGEVTYQEPLTRGAGNPFKNDPFFDKNKNLFDEVVNTPTRTREERRRRTYADEADDEHVFGPEIVTTHITRDMDPANNPSPVRQTESFVKTSYHYPQKRSRSPNRSSSKSRIRNIHRNMINSPSQKYAVRRSERPVERHNSQSRKSTSYVTTHQTNDSSPYRYEKTTVVETFGDDQPLPSQIDDEVKESFEKSRRIIDQMVKSTKKKMEELRLSIFDTNEAPFPLGAGGQFRTYDF